MAPRNSSGINVPSTLRMLASLRIMAMWGHDLDPSTTSAQINPTT
ncbi:MAG: hypothetical protein ACYC61_25235 [Isosphaeraceae bacterium]